MPPPTIPTPTKRCSKCGESKPLSGFTRRYKGRDHLRSECRDCANIGNRDWHRKQDRAFHKNSTLQAHYGITLADYERMLAEQNGVCAICGKATEKSLAVDHDHATGKVRALLCARCNTGLGCFEENELLFLRAMEYLRNYRGD